MSAIIRTLSYGDGLNIRDWLFVEDHCSAIETVLEKGTPGETYNVGGNCQKTNLEIVHAICDAVNEAIPSRPHKCRDLITFVKDRPGHDRRYAIDASKIKSELGWEPKTQFADGIRNTVQWYIDNSTWVQRVMSGDCQRERLGIT